jgi:hypothetical protein
MDAASATELVTALTPLLTGPTAGLATVLLLLLGAGGLTYWGFLPLLRASWDRQNKALESTTLAMQGVQAALEKLTHESSTRFTAIEADIEKMRSDVRILAVRGSQPMSPDRLT